MRIAVLSDIHINIRTGDLLNGGMNDVEAAAWVASAFAPAIEEARKSDIVVLAGDIAEGSAGLLWAAESFPKMPVVYVAGNHEYYGHDLTVLRPELEIIAAKTNNVHFLENRSIELNLLGRDLRILGCTLWTDYELHGAEKAQEAMQLAEDRIADHRWIANGGQQFLPAHARELHFLSRQWLRAELEKSYSGTTIVVTHHSPCQSSNPPQFEGSPLSPAFASDLTELMHEYSPQLWIHGHTHHNSDYRLRETRIVSHQWGYPEEELPMDVMLVEI